MTKKETKLLIDFLEDYADRLTCDGCNDWKFPPNWTKPEKAKLTKDFHDYNNSSEEDREYMKEISDNHSAVSILIEKLRISIK